MEIDYNAVFGLDSPVEEAQERTGVAVGADREDVTEDGAGAEEQEVADPDEIDEEEAESEGESDDGPSGAEAQPRSEKSKFTKQDEDFAAARRRAEKERDRAIEAQRAQSTAEMDALVASMNLRHPVSGELITTKAQYDEYRKAKNSAEADRQLTRAGLSREMIADVVKALPEVQAATEAASQMTAARLSAERERQKSVFEAEMKLISEDDPTVKSVEDLKAKPYFDAMYEKIRAGYTLSDAYRLATYDAHAASIAEKARTQAARSAAGKNHLRPAQSRGTSTVTVPAGVLNQYRVLFPDASDAEISRMYARELNRK